MRVFLDFEASSLARDGYPIEVAWVFETGEAEAHLIRPAPPWIDWDTGAQRLHGVSRQTLFRDGEPHDSVAARVVEQLSGHAVFASAPSWDGKWMSLLLRAAGFPRHAIRVRATEEALVEAAREAWRDAGLAGPPSGVVKAIVQQARTRVVLTPPAHRALPDAEQERQVWLRVRELARSAASGAGPSASAGPPPASRES
jgi:hypothetical protein